MVPDTFLDDVYDFLDLASRDALAHTCRYYANRYANAHYWRPLLYDCLVAHARQQFKTHPLTRFFASQDDNSYENHVAETAATLAAIVPDGAMHIATRYLLSLLARPPPHTKTVPIADVRLQRRSRVVLPFPTMMGVQLGTPQEATLHILHRADAATSPWPADTCAAVLQSGMRSYVPSYWERVAPKDVAAARSLVLQAVGQPSFFFGLFTAAGDVGFLRLLRAVGSVHVDDKWRLLVAFAPLAVMHATTVVLDYLLADVVHGPDRACSFAGWVVEALPWAHDVIGDDALQRCLAWSLDNGPSELVHRDVVAALLSHDRVPLALWYVRTIAPSILQQHEASLIAEVAAAMQCADVLDWLCTNVPIVASLVSQASFVHQFLDGPRERSLCGRYAKGIRYAWIDVVRWLVMRPGVPVDVELLAWAVANPQHNLFPFFLERAGGCPRGAEARLLDAATSAHYLTLLLRCDNVRPLWTSSLYLGCKAGRIRLLRRVEPPCPMDATAFNDAVGRADRQACQALLEEPHACPVDARTAWATAIHNSYEAAPAVVDGFRRWLADVIGPPTCMKWRRRLKLYKVDG
jgi:hypothetical protein